MTGFLVLSYFTSHPASPDSGLQFLISPPLDVFLRICSSYHCSHNTGQARLNCEPYCTLLTACDRPATVWCQPPKNLPEMLLPNTPRYSLTYSFIARQAGKVRCIINRKAGILNFSSFLLAWLNQTKFPLLLTWCESEGGCRRRRMDCIIANCPENRY